MQKLYDDNQKQLHKLKDIGNQKDLTIKKLEQQVENLKKQTAKTPERKRKLSSRGSSTDREVTSKNLKAI